MPIYDQHYRLWEGRPRPRALRWTVITRYHLRQLFTGKGRFGLFALLAGSTVVHLLFLAAIYFSANTAVLESFGLPPKSPWTIDAQFFFRDLVIQGTIVGLLALMVGSGLIAEDRRDNSLPFYLSKPLTPAEYLLGKFFVLGFFVLAVTAVPLNLLYLCHVLMGGGREFLVEYAWLPLAITAFSLIVTAYVGAVMLLASSLVKKSSLAGVLVVGMFIGLSVMANVMEQNFYSRRFYLFSPYHELKRLGYWLFRITTADPQMSQFTGPEAAAVMLGIVVLCWLAVWWRIRPVEVVK